MPTLFDDPNARALMEPREAPDVQKLLGWVKDDVYDMWSLGFFFKLQKCYRTRMCWHPGKSDDAQSGDEVYGVRKAFPYPGALDHDMRLADMLVNEFVQNGMSVWHRSEKTVRPRDAMDDEQSQKAQAWRHALDFMLDLTKIPMVDNLELFLNCMGEFGQGILFEGWEQRMRLGRKTISWSDFVDSVTRAAFDEWNSQNPSAQLPDALAQEIQQQTITTLSLAIQIPEMDGDIVERLQAFDPMMPEDEAKRVLRAFREGDLSAVAYYAPVPVQDRPVHQALVPGIDCVWPVRCYNFDKLPRFTRLVWMTEAEIRVAVEQDGWDREQAEKVLKAGISQCIDITTIGGGATFAGWEINGIDIGLQLSSTASLKNASLYQFAEAYYVGVSKAGLPAVYRTIMHSSADKPLHHACDYSSDGRMPFVRGVLEKMRNLDIASRGIPEIVLSHQLGLKVLDDSITAQSELRSNPPRVQSIDGGLDGLRPGGTLRGRISGGRIAAGVELLQVPEPSAGSLQGRENLKHEADEYFGRAPSEMMDPAVKANRQAWLAHKFAAIYEEILKVMCGHMQANVDVLHIGSSGGQPINARVSGEDLQGELDITVTVPEDLDLLVRKLEAWQKFALPMDRMGLTDYAFSYRFATQQLFPQMGRFGVQAPDVATDRIKEDEKQFIAQVVSGVPLEADDFKKRIDNPQLRIQQWQNWLQVPGNMQKAMSDPELHQRITMRLQGLAFPMQQHQQNADTGKLGVQLEDPMMQQVKGLLPQT